MVLSLMPQPRCSTWWKAAWSFADYAKKGFGSRAYVRVLFDIDGAGDVREWAGTFEAVGDEHFGFKNENFEFLKLVNGGVVDRNILLIYGYCFTSNGGHTNQFLASSDLK